MNILIYILGNLEDEDKVLEWLSYQIKHDEIEDVTDEMLDILINKLSNVAVLFCKLNIFILTQQKIYYLIYVDF